MTYSFEVPVRIDWLRRHGHGRRIKAYPSLEQLDAGVDPFEFGHYPLDLIPLTKASNLDLIGTIKP